MKFEIGKPENPEKSPVHVWLEKLSNGGFVVYAQKDEKQSYLFIVTDEGMLIRANHVDPCLGFSLNNFGQVALP